MFAHTHLLLAQPFLLELRFYEFRMTTRGGALSTGCSPLRSWSMYTNIITCDPWMTGVRLYIPVSSSDHSRHNLLRSAWAFRVTEGKLWFYFIPAATPLTGFWWDKKTDRWFCQVRAAHARRSQLLQKPCRLGFPGASQPIVQVCRTFTPWDCKGKRAVEPPGLC